MSILSLNLSITDGIYRIPIRQNSRIANEPLLIPKQKDVLRLSILARGKYRALWKLRQTHKEHSYSPFDYHKVKNPGFASSLETYRHISASRRKPLNTDTLCNMPIPQVRKHFLISPTESSDIDSLELPSLNEFSQVRARPISPKFSQTQHQRPTAPRIGGKC